MSFCTRPFTASIESWTTAFKKQRRCPGLLPNTSKQGCCSSDKRKENQTKSGLVRRTGIETTRRKYRRVKDFPKRYQNNAFVFSLVFISQGQAFTSILHCSSLPVYFSLHPILQASSPPTVIKSPVKNLRWVWKASPAHKTASMSSKDLEIGCHNPTKFLWAEIRAVLLFRSSHDQNNKRI